MTLIIFKGEKTMEEFIKKLNDLYNSTVPIRDWLTEEPGTKYFYDCEQKRELKELCKKFLVKENGKSNYNNIRKLRKNGFIVHQASRIEYEWPVGTIQKRGDDRILVYSAY